MNDFQLSPAGESGIRAYAIADQARSVAPVVWLLGKVQSGKSSIVRGLTRNTAAEIGTGFRACTMTASVYDFPTEAPLIRFLDTRGLGETAYDPADDLKIAEETAHCIIAVMRAMDTQQESVIDVLQQVRIRQPHWPVLIAQTHLHEGYPPGMKHVLPYPFKTNPSHKNYGVSPAEVPNDLLRSLNYQRVAMSALRGTGKIAFVPLDFTTEDDDFDPQFYGLSALESALADIVPTALHAALLDVQTDVRAGGSSDNHALIVGHAAAASAADLVPVAAVAAVPAVHANLLRKLAQAHGISWTRRIGVQFIAALGAGFAARYALSFGIRQLTKLTPVYGQTVGTATSAAMSFATTFALGKAASYFLTKYKDGEADAAGVRAVWARSLREAFALAKMRGLERHTGGADDSVTQD